MPLRKHLLLTAVLVAAPAMAHQSPLGMNYSAYCCQGVSGTGTAARGDCAPIPATSVKAVIGGFQVTLGPGDHPLVTKPHSFFIPYGQEKHSTDGAYHGCLFPTENNIRCLYVPDMGS